MRYVDLSQSDVRMALSRAQRLKGIQNDRSFRLGIKPEVGIAAIGIEKLYPSLVQPNEKKQVWVDKKGRKIKVCTKRRALESGTKASHDASAHINDCADADIDVFVFASVEMPKDWKDTFPDQKELENPKNYRLCFAGWMDREEFNQEARQVNKGKQEGPTWSASIDCKSIKHSELKPLFVKGK